MEYFAGIDWGSELHAACLIDDQGTVVFQRTVDHTAKGIKGLIRAFARFARSEQVPIAIERPDGLLVNALVEAGHAVVPIHPNALKASRPRYHAAISKSDSGDGFILADLLRTDGHRFRALHPTSDEILALRALVRTRDDLVAHRIAVANQLRALLQGFWAGPVDLFADLTSTISLAFLDRYPTPQHAHRLGIQRLKGFLSVNRYSGRRSPEDLLARLRAAPASFTGPQETQAKGELVRALVTLLRTLLHQINQLTRRIQDDVATLPTGRILMSFPRAGRLNAAQILAEIGDDPERFQTENQLAAEAGVCPVTRASGKSHAVLFRFACNKRLRVAITTFAANSRFESDWAAANYQRARQRGCDHPHAVRILARAWLRVIWRCWKKNTPYEPLHHGAARRLLETT